MRRLLPLLILVGCAAANPAGQFLDLENRYAADATLLSDYRKNFHPEPAVLALDDLAYSRLQAARQAGYSAGSLDAVIATLAAYEVELTREGITSHANRTTVAH